jgi:transcription antitermination factor NusG
MKQAEEKAWYAVYTTPRAEKKVCDRLQARGIVVYLPLQRKLRQWSDRKKWVEVPLLPSYLFVNVADQQQIAVLKEQGVIKFVCQDGRPAQVREADIDWLRRLLKTGVEIELTSETLQPGDIVEVQNGFLAGFRGELVEYKGEKRVVLQLHYVGQSMLITIPSTQLQKVHQPI